MTHPLLKDAPVGTRFIDRTTGDAIEYEIVEVPRDRYTEFYGSLRGRAVDAPHTYVLGSWLEGDDIEIVTNLYDQVEAMAPGIIFQVGKGVPWMRTATGVQDLSDRVLALAIRTQTFDDIPEVWKKYSGPAYAITILYNPKGVA